MAGISLNGAYNHFIQDYVSKDVTQADAHRKDELRDVYKSIARLNKKSPLYLLTDDDKSRNEAIDIKERARQLQGSIIGLNNQTGKSSLNHSSAYTSDEDKVLASYIGKTPEEDVGNIGFDINVTQLATPQTNTGRYLPKDSTGLPAGNYAFDVRIGQQDFEFQFSIYNGDRNIDIQDKLEKLINKAGIGLSANIIEEGGRSALQISSTKTGLRSGETSQFEIFENNPDLQKGAVSYLGLDQVSAPATNAHFSLNGEEKISISNKFTVGGKFELQLKDTTEFGSTIHVGVQNDNEALKKHIHSLVDNYNDFVKEASGAHVEKFKSDKLKSDTVGLAIQHMSGIEDIGIKLESDGTLSIDDELLSQAISGPGSKEALAPINNFSDALIEKTKEISIDPMKYVDRPVVNYRNPDSRDTSSPYITSEYSGMMFNNYC
ncbi:flagellar filament capping protein FliD [Butyrivibrio sp. DSM 10294]|uniref:flagellar filament capping protein FliD n=1 Tax=Butyrivibrio sp. DSM 10294 TaxID=2972457 RepID=UPI00234F42C6|nr:flagellar filament capping protein FliD [Butyrivibrio sp. DSM 10294]MDC7293076.1 flagellar filament capping protein FliD [Butyrivibrio sp. DSM 10294]